MQHDEVRQVVGADSDDVDDSDVGESAGSRPEVDRRGADAEHLGDLADGEKLLDRRKQIGSKISGKPT
jgi:hypothetical protein